MAQVLAGLLQFFRKFVPSKRYGPFPQNNPTPKANQMVAPRTIPPPPAQADVMKKEYQTGE
jgi:hypothetical protein